MTQRQNIGLIVWYYLGWFGCVYFGRWGISNWSLIFPMMPMVYLLKSKTISIAQFLFLVKISMVGIIFDSAAYYFQWITFPNHQASVIPTWLVSMWLLFATIFPLSHRLFKTKLGLAAVLGAIVGPLSYYSGVAFESISFGHRNVLFIYAIFWGIYFPIVHYFYRKTYEH